MYKKIKNTGNKIKDTGYRINDTGYKILITGYWIHDIGYFRKRISFPRSKYTLEHSDGRRAISQQLHCGSKLSSTMINYVYTLFKFVGWPKCTDSTDFFCNSKIVKFIYNFRDMSQKCS